MELANEVYIFTSPGAPGIKFYDRSPEGVVVKFAGSLPNSKFQTDIYSISQARWDSNINKINNSQVVNTPRGSYVATTIMVTEEQLLKILQSIEDSKNKSCIIIEVEKASYKNVDLAELGQMKRDLINQFNNPTLNDKNYIDSEFDNTVGKKY